MDNIDFIETPLTPPGKSAVRSQKPYPENTTITPEGASAHTLNLNQPEEIRKRFLGPSLYRREVESEAMVITHIPTGQYSAGAVQITAIRPEIVKDRPIKLTSAGRIPTLSIYDFPPDAQIEYARQILSAFSFINKELPDYARRENAQVLFTENAAYTVSDENYRIARTLAEPHTQIWLVGENTEPFDPKKTPKLLKFERRVIGLLSNQIIENLKDLKEQFIAKTDLDLDFAIRKAPPYGYIITTPIHQSMSIDKQAKIYTSLMKAHHHLYTTESQRLAQELQTSSHHRESKKHLLPQPSYKLYGIYNKNGYLEISIAPTLFAGTGVVEILDRSLERNPLTAPDVPSLEQENQFYGHLSQKLEDAPLS